MEGLWSLAPIGRSGASGCYPLNCRYWMGREGCNIASLWTRQVPHYLCSPIMLAHQGRSVDLRPPLD